MKNRKSYIGFKRARPSRKKKISWEDSHRSTIDYSNEYVIIEFRTAKRLRDFLNNKKEIISNDGGLFVVITIRKIKQTQIEAKVEKITLREYNLNKLGI